MKILSIQSWVAAGHVGNAAALFPLQRLGAAVLAINTVQFSNHPGHGAFTGRALAAPEVADLVRGLADHDALGGCDAVLTGYLGDAALGSVVLDAVASTRAASPAALWCCDPVMGDDGRLYVSPGIPPFFAGQALGQADIVTPNQFELALLAGTDCTTETGIIQAALAVRARLRPRGPRIVLVTSARTPQTPPWALDMWLCCEQGIFRLRSDLLPAHFSGAGDTLAALFLFHVLHGLAPPDAACRAASSMAGLLRRTLDAGARELLIVDAQDEFHAPTCAVVAERIDAETA